MSVASSIPVKQIWRVFAITSAIALAYASVLGKLGHDWWTDENYSHGLLVPFVIGFILWSQRHRFAREAQRPAMIAGLGVVSVWLSCAVGGDRRGRTLSAAHIAVVLVRRDGDLFLGFQAAAIDDCSVVSAVAGHSYSGNHLQQSRISFTALCFALRCVSYAAF